MLRIFANLKLVYKLLVPLAVLVAVVLGILWETRSSFDQLGSATDTAFEHTVARRGFILALLAAVNDATVQEKNVIIDDDDAEMKRFNERFQASIAEALDAADRLIEVSTSPEQRAKNQELKRDILDFKEAAEKSIALALDHDRDAASKQSRTGSRAARLKLTSLAKERVKKIAEELRQTETEIRALRASTLTNLYIVAGVGLAMSLSVLGAIVTFLVVRPLKAITGALERLAGGELTIEVNGAERKDEVGALARSLDVFKKNALEAKRLAVEQEELKARAAAQQKAALNRMADDFEKNVGGS